MFVCIIKHTNWRENVNTYQERQRFMNPIIRTYMIPRLKVGWSLGQIMRKANPFGIRGALTLMKQFISPYMTNILVSI